MPEGKGELTIKEEIELRLRCVELTNESLKVDPDSRFHWFRRANEIYDWVKTGQVKKP